MAAATPGHHNDFVGCAYHYNLQTGDYRQAIAAAIDEAAGGVLKNNVPNSDIAGRILRGPRPDFLPGADIAPRKVNWHNRSQVRPLHAGMLDGDVWRSEIGSSVEEQENPFLFNPLRCLPRPLQTFRRKIL